MISIVFLNQNYLVQGEVIRALRRLPNVRVVALNIISHPGSSQADSVVEILKREHCRILFTINEWGIDSSGVINEFIEKSGILHVNWCVDDPYYEEIIECKKFRPLETRFDFVSDRDYITRMRTDGYHVEFLPLATDPSLFFSNGSIHDKTCVFVGNSYITQVDTFVRDMDAVLQPMVPYLAKLLEQYKKDCMSIDIENAISEHVASLELPETITLDKAIFVCKHVIGYLYRKELIGFCSHAISDFKVYGDTGWESILPQSVVCGTVRYGECLRNLYNTVKVNLDCNRVVIRDGFTQRTFDALACRQFLITGDKPVIKEMFETGDVGLEIVTFRNQAELVEKVNYYCKNEEERSQIAARGFKRVLNEHTYDHRVKSIFNRITPMLH